jgi:hypothetical protein
LEGSVGVHASHGSRVADVRALHHCRATVPLSSSRRFR